MPAPRAPVVLTVGASSGIGLATVIEVARKGFDSVGSVRWDRLLPTKMKDRLARVSLGL